MYFDSLLEMQSSGWIFEIITDCVIPLIKSLEAWSEKKFWRVNATFESYIYRYAFFLHMRIEFLAAVLYTYELVKSYQWSVCEKRVYSIKYECEIIRLIKSIFMYADYFVMTATVIHNCTRLHYEIAVFALTNYCDLLASIIIATNTLKLIYFCASCKIKVLLKPKLSYT